MAFNRVCCSLAWALASKRRAGTPSQQSDVEHDVIEPSSRETDGILRIDPSRAQALMTRHDRPGAP